MTFYTYSSNINTFKYFFFFTYKMTCIKLQCEGCVVLKFGYFKFSQCGIDLRVLGQKFTLKKEMKKSYLVDHFLSAVRQYTCIFGTIPHIFVQGSPTDRGVSKCYREDSIMRRSWPTGGCCTMEGTNLVFSRLHSSSQLQDKSCCEDRKSY